MRIPKQARSPALAVAAALLVLGGLPALASERDSRIEASAKSSYNFKTWLKADNIDVKSSGGVVTLTGTVSQEHHKILAEQTVAGLPGARRVDNQLTVVGEQPGALSDGWVTLKVKAVLAFHKNVSAAATEVRTEAGAVSLSGSAGSEAQKQLTAEYAKDVEGVTAVHNELVVAPAGKGPVKAAVESAGEEIDDASITAQIKTTLLFHKSTHALDTRVTTKDGVVTLKGKAGNAAEKDLVSKLAEDINGVKQVQNRMTVGKS